MPSRAFFCFGERRSTSLPRLARKPSQCPRGHFFVLGPTTGPWPVSVGGGLNALAGIFLFWGEHTAGAYPGFVVESQCPRGHFFVLGRVGSGLCARGVGCVSMPSRAFFCFGAMLKYCVSEPDRFCLNALAGIFLFWGASQKQRSTPCQLLSQCPRGHFLFWGDINLSEQARSTTVSMPSRAFFVLG